MPLTERDERLLRLVTTVVLGDWDGLRGLRRGAPAGEPDRGWRETLLQAHLFAGFPKVVEALAVLGSEGGLGAPEPEELEPGSPGPSPGGSPDRAHPERALGERGARLFDRIYAGHADRVRAFLEGAHPDFARWVAEHAYGRVLTRPGLGADRRELLAVVALAATDQDRQLASHARGALRCGAEPAELERALEVVGDLLGRERSGRARRAVARITSTEGRGH